MPYNGCRACYECAEISRCIKGCYIAHNVFDKPAAYYAVIAENDERSKNSEDTYDFCFRIDHFVALYRISPCVSSKAHFEHHTGQTENKYENEIYNKKCKSAVFAHQIREFPKVAQTYGCTRSCKQKAYSAAPLFFSHN